MTRHWTLISDPVTDRLRFNWLAEYYRRVFAFAEIRRLKRLLRQHYIPESAIATPTHCKVVINSGLSAPRTWRCWYPLPCPIHRPPTP